MDLAARLDGGHGRVAIEAGQQLAHYRLIEKIGEDGMGILWKAEVSRMRSCRRFRPGPRVGGIVPRGEPWLD